MRLAESFTAAEPKRFHIPGEYFVLDSVPAGSVTALFFRNGKPLYDDLVAAGPGWAVTPAGGFDLVEITSSLTQAVSFYITRGSVRPKVMGMVDERRGQTLLFAAIDVAGAGDNQIVAADANKKIKVAGYVIVADAAVAARWKRAGTSLSGAMSFAANGGVAAAPIAPAGGHWFETALNEALNLNLSAAVGARGHLIYFLEA